MENPDAFELDWDDDNIEHIARHGVSPDEVEQVFRNDYFMKKDTGTKDDKERYIIAGRTNGEGT